MSPREINRLSAVTVRNAKTPGRYADGDGLYLYVMKEGSRSWVFRYRDRTTGKLRDKGLGRVRDVSLEQARGKARECRQLLLSGADPIDSDRAARQSLLAERARAVTFGDCAQRYIAAHRAGWRNDKHAAQWESTLKTYAGGLYPLSVADVDVAAVIRVLEPIWTDKTETATRVRQRIEAVLDWATARGFRLGENPARWRGHLSKLLPAPAKLKKVQHRPALPYDELPDFMAVLREKQGLAPSALELVILTATRPNEAAGAGWSEFDLKSKRWTIPAERMKAHREHRVPLSDRAVLLLKATPELGEYVFPGKPGRPLTTAAMLKVLQELRPGLTVHGFRSTFRDWAADCTSYPRDVVEEALAHVQQDKTEAAYRRTDMFAKRAALMQDWARHCEPRPPASITRIEKARRKRRA